MRKSRKMGLFVTRAAKVDSKFPKFDNTFWLAAARKGYVRIGVDGVGGLGIK